jgi:hypothetical protein
MCYDLQHQQPKARTRRSKGSTSTKKADSSDCIVAGPSKAADMAQMKKDFQRVLNDDAGGNFF